MTYITLDACGICGGGLGEKRTAAAPSFVADLAPGFSVRAAALCEYSQCDVCGVWMQTPRLDDDTLGRYYSEGIYRATLGITTERLDADELARAKFDAGLIAAHIGEVESHLDIGCSRGYLLREVGANTRAGVEPNADWTRESEGVVSSLDQIDRLYSLVTMIHVLEHEPYPVDYLKRAAKLLEPGGRMIVEVPSWQSKGGPLRLAHLWHWETGAMRDTAKRAGLKVVKMLGTPHLFVILEAA
jgi:SAM-dependent methyltransferase